MKYAKTVKVLFGFLICTLIFTSCGKDKFKKEIDKEDFKKEGEYDDWEKECFKFIYPISFQAANDVITSINNDDEWKQFWTDWKTNNSDAATKPQIVFPFGINWDGTDEIVSVENTDQFEVALYDCKEKLGHYKDWKKDCFEFVFPLRFENEDASIAVLNSEEEMKTFFIEWKENNPDATEKPAIVYPFSISKIETDVNVVIENEEGLFDAFEECK